MMKSIVRIVLVLICIGCIGAYVAYDTIWGDNLNPDVDKHILYIPNGTTLTTLTDSLATNQLLQSTSSFKRTATLMSFADAAIKPGRYNLSSSPSNRAIIQKLRLGDQEAIDLIINNGRTMQEVCDNIADQLPLSSAELYDYFMSPNLLKEWKTDKQNVIGKVLPDTYKVFWNITPEQLAVKLQREYAKYWNTERASKLEQLGLTKAETTTLASIVQKETNANEEKPTIAGVYLNRIARGMLLQADPTVVFATGKFDLKRVLNKHLRMDSPYNTYKYAGLPPGPICMPSKPSIDAVLNHAKHKYLYFCAKPDYSGLHDFSSNLVQHNNYANKYRRWLSSQGIR